MTNWIIQDKPLSDMYDERYNYPQFSSAPGMLLSDFEACCGYMIVSDFDTTHHFTIESQRSRLFFVIGILREEHADLTGVMAVVTDEQFKKCPGLKKLLTNIGFTLMAKPKSKETGRTLYTYVWLNKSRRSGKN